MATATTVLERILDKEPATAVEQALVDDLRIGLDRMRQMSHDELRGVISRRLELLQGTLADREARRDALETARLAAGLMDVRRARSRRIKRQVDRLSTLAVIAGTLVLFGLSL